MPDISAFHGIRYDLGQVGSLSNVIAPPYDVIDSQLQQELLDKHPANCVRIVLGQDQDGDDDTNNRYTRAARTMRNWLREGVLFAEGEPAIYVYHQVFTEGEQELTRRGFMCRTRLERFGKGNIYPHEETHGGAKADRLKLWKACKANCSQIFGLYPDESNIAQEILEEAIRGVAPLEATDHLGVLHRIWPVNDIATITDVIAAMGGLPIYIADGHHRYETACNYRDELAAELAAKGEQLDPEHPANFVLMMCVSMSDPGMIVLPTHRLFRGLHAMTSQDLQKQLGECFNCDVSSTGPETAPGLWEEIEMEGDQGTMAFYTAEDQTWTVARLTAEGQQKMAEISSDHCSDWQGLGVSLLHRLVMDHLLDKPNLPAPKYVRAIEEVVEGLQQGDSAGRDHTGQQGTGGRFELAAMVMPATVDHIRAISNANERMPAKSTYFYPKLLSGLLFNPLE
ncbi:DUF1015 domain-containing protein [Bythopirellula polymerisocia]|uniref:Phosphatase n=1 Tax=Bythopirellula polymerisocia TaxID=2528003 RepID=A0A5C6CU03_9BACT|nr:DUF1015 domain-containing protein [Bythopirellula polymerisocia]TWU28433.1 hypothetical protein Pla144_17220 [Bythopirellula polymerisocia]